MSVIKHITIVFAGLEKVHFFKDVGMVPYHLARCLGAELTYVHQGSADIKNPFADLHAAVVNVPDIPSYVRRHAKQIDLLMLFHITTRTITYGTIYKKQNPTGCLYIKYDSEETCIPYLHEKSWYALSRYKRRFLFRRFEPLVDLLSVECQQVYERIDEFNRAKLHYLPNGIFFGVVDEVASPLSDIDKENIILLVGRHGSHQKNSEMIFDLIPRLSCLAGWKFVLLGPVTDAFQKKYQDFINARPDCAGIIEIIGNLADRTKVADFYKKAKILLLPSRSEGFPIVCSEALSQGVVVCMAHELTSSIDITKDGQIGFRIPRENLDAWRAVLSSVMSDEKRRLSLALASREHFRNALAWEVTIPLLAKRMLSGCSQEHELTSTEVVPP